MMYEIPFPDHQYPNIVVDVSWLSSIIIIVADI